MKWWRIPSTGHRPPVCNGATSYDLCGQKPLNNVETHSLSAWYTQGRNKLRYSSGAVHHHIVSTLVFHKVIGHTPVQLRIRAASEARVR